MIEIWTPALAGMIAGLGVAMPLGGSACWCCVRGWSTGFASLLRQPPGLSVSGTIHQSSAWRAFARFVVLTAINPITLVYFVALAGAVTTSNDSWVAPVVLVAAVGLASLAWQLVLAGAGSLSGASISARAGRIVGVIASGLVVSLGAAVLASAVVAFA